MTIVVHLALCPGVSSAFLPLQLLTLNAITSCGIRALARGDLKFDPSLEGDHARRSVCSQTNTKQPGRW
jgi:hypothetical protein